jgi:hypothetical protein
MVFSDILVSQTGRTKMPPPGALTAAFSFITEKY